MKNKKLHIWIALAVIVFFVCIAVFGCGEDIKGIRDMRFGIDIRGGVEAVFEPSGLKKNADSRTVGDSKRGHRNSSGFTEYIRS